MVGNQYGGGDGDGAGGGTAGERVAACVQVHCPPPLQALAVRYQEYQPHLNEFHTTFETPPFSPKYRR